MKTATGNRILVFLAVAVFLLLLLPLTVRPASAASLVFTNDIDIVSGSIYNSQLRVQTSIKRNNKNPQQEGHQYTYTLFVSTDSSDFENVLDLSESGLTGTELAVDHNADIATNGPLDVSVSVALENVSPDATYYFTVEAKHAAPGQESETVYGYTPVWSVNPQTPDAAQQYLVACGSPRTYAYTPFGLDPTSEAAFSANQSVTWQKFGADPSTGKQWGIVGEYNRHVSDGDYTLLGSQLESRSATMEFKFEMDDADTEYDVVMGMKDLNEISMNSAADITVNGGEEVLGSYHGTYNAKVVYFTDVKAVADGTGKYFLTITLNRTDVSQSNPTCNFISIRNKSTEENPVENKFLTSGYSELNIQNGTKVSELDQNIVVYMTDGPREVPVAYEQLVDANLAPVDMDTELAKTFVTIERTAVVTLGEGRDFRFPVDINIWTNEDLYYFIDCNQRMPFTPGLDRLKYAEEQYDTLLNTDLLDKAATGSDDWGYIGEPMTPYWGNRSPYESYWAGNNIIYNFPNLPAGDYVFEIGYIEPWGARTMIFTYNGQDPEEGSEDYISGRSGTNQKQFRFHKEKDSDPCFIQLSGVGGEALVGWMAISSAPADPDAGGTVIDTPAPASGNTNLVLVIVIPAVLLIGGAVASFVLLRKKRG